MYALEALTEMCAQQGVTMTAVSSAIGRSKNYLSVAARKSGFGADVFNEACRYLGYKIAAESERDFRIVTFPDNIGNVSLATLSNICTTLEYRLCVYSVHDRGMVIYL